MKKSITLILAALLTAASCTACGKSSGSSSKETTTAASTSAPASAAETTEAMTESTSAAAVSTESSTEASTEASGKIDLNSYITQSTPKPALWKATDPSTGNVLYLMGTIHLIGDPTLPLPDYIMDVYNSCDGVAVEYDVVSLETNTNELTKYLSSMIYTDGTTIQQHIKPETYTAARDVMKKAGVYNSMLDYYNPGLWISEVQSIAFNEIDNIKMSGIDAEFINMAKKDGKEVVNIETLETQIGVVMSYSDELADFVLADAAKVAYDTQYQAEAFSEIYNAWATGDIDKLADEDDTSEELPKELEADSEAYQKIVIADRNKGMAERAEEFLKNGDNYFFMVGVLHFSGDEGVDDILAEKGYKVERIA